MWLYTYNAIARSPVTLADTVLTDGELTVSYNRWIHNETDKPPVEVTVKVCAPELTLIKSNFPSALTGQVSGSF